MNYDTQKSLIAEYLHKSEKPPEKFLIGAELEYFVVDQDSLRSINYFEKNGIKELLLELVEKGYSPLQDGNDIVGAEDQALIITLEPGAQFEISLTPRNSVKELEAEYLRFREFIKPLLRQRGQKLLSSGYHPVSRIEELPFIPKQRYKFMSEYLTRKGDLALNMMKGTASIQVAIDYSSEQDFIRKMRLASRLTPVLSAVYDNTSVFEGKTYKSYNLRTRIWNNCDDDRCGIIKQIFESDFSYQKYAEYVLEQIPIFYFKNGKMIPFEREFKYVFNPETDIDFQLNHIFSMCFPDVRARKYIELRMTDSLPYPLNFAYLELIEKIFYDDLILTQVEDLIGDLSFKEVIEAKQDSIRSGIKAEMRGRTIQSFFQIILEIIGSEGGEHLHLNRKLAETGIIPRIMKK